MKHVSATVSARPGGGVSILHTVQIDVPAGTSMLEAETLMQAALVEAGAAIIGEFLHASDADGQPLDYQNRRFTAKAEKESRLVECTFGAVTVTRSAYQSSSGGKCYYPLDHKMELALATVKAHYPNALYDGISDGARDFVPWLKANTDQLTLDFYHAAG